MSYEKKIITDEWDEQCISADLLQGLWDELTVIRQRIEECCELLAEEGITLYHEISQEWIDCLMEQRMDVLEYAQKLGMRMFELLDEPLYDGFSRETSLWLSKIHLSDFKTGNTVGLPSGGYYVGRVPEQAKLYGTGQVPNRVQNPTLSFADFLGEWVEDECNFGKMTGPEENESAGAYTLLKKEQSATVLLAGGSLHPYMGRFADIFAKQYAQMEEAGAFAEEELKDFSEYQEWFDKYGEFHHTVDAPGLKFLEGLMATLIIPPFLEAMSGETLLTGEELNGYERGMRVVFAVIDSVTLGRATASVHFVQAGGANGFALFKKVALTQITSDTAAYSVMEVGEYAGLPVPLTVILSLGTGLMVEHWMSRWLGVHGGERFREWVFGGSRYSKYIEQLDSFSENRIDHIINGSRGSNHGWENLVPDKNWNDIKNIIAEVMETGVEGSYKTVYSKKAIINGFEVEVTYTKLSDGTIKISDAWINP